MPQVSQHLRSLQKQLVTMHTVRLLLLGALTTLVSGQVTPTPSPIPPGRNRWFAGRYTPCSKSCEGRQTREVYCQRTISDGRKFRVEDSFCDRDDLRFKPIAERTCGVECATYTWDTSEWSDCSVACGSGTQTRTVRCRKVTRTSDTIQDDSECSAAGIGSKPSGQRACRSICRYQTGQWRACSVTCGGGVRRRTVQCIHTASDGSTTTVTLSDCAADRTLVIPDISEECNTDPCGEFMWEAGEYGECSDQCGGIRTRAVYCVLVFDDGSSLRVNDSDCDSRSKPGATTPCAQHVAEDDALYDLIRDSVCPDTCCLGGSCEVAPRPCRFTYPGKDCACPITMYAGTCQQEIVKMEREVHVDVRVACTCQHADEGGRQLEKLSAEPLPTVTGSA